MIEPIYNREYFRDRTDELKNRHVQDIVDLIEFFHKRLNVKMHIHYGTLLGAIRENNFIAHDKDIDLAYISSYESKEAIISELEDIAWILRNENMLVKDFNGRGQMHVRVPNGSLVVDVWTSYIRNGRYCLIPFGDLCSKDVIYPFKLSLLRNLYLEVPNQSEILLDILYKDWKNPITKDENYLKKPKRGTIQ